MPNVPPPTLQPHHNPAVYRQLLGYAEDHAMEVLLDSGLHRHLRFSSPTTNIGSFDLITWPGSLVIRGDIGQGFLFTATDDMLSFFRQAPGHINPGYWAEKLSRGSREVKVYSADLMLASALEEIDSWDLPLAHRRGARESFTQQWEDLSAEDESSQRDLVRGFTYARPKFHFPQALNNLWGLLKL